MLPNHVASVELVATMDEVRAAVSAALDPRKAEKLRAHQPFHSLIIAMAGPAELTPFRGLVAEEINIEKVQILDVESAGYEARTDLALNPCAFSPEIRKLTSKLFTAVKTNQWELTEDGDVRFNGVLLDGAPVVLEAEDSAFILTTRIEVDDDSLAATMLPSGAFVVLDTAPDDALKAEGWARGLVRLVQDERKAADLHVGDRIRLELRIPQDKDAWTGVHLDLVKREVDCVDTSVVADPAVKEPTATVGKIVESAAGTGKA